MNRHLRNDEAKESGAEFEPDPQIKGRLVCPRCDGEPKTGHYHDCDRKELELQERRRLMEEVEFVLHEANEYELEQRVCPWCHGLHPEDFERIDSWNRYRYKSGHTPDCVYAKLQREAGVDYGG